MPSVQRLLLPPAHRRGRPHGAFPLGQVPASRLPLLRHSSPPKPLAASPWLSTDCPPPVRMPSTSTSTSALRLHPTLAISASGVSRHDASWHGATALICSDQPRPSFPSHPIHRLTSTAHPQRLREEISALTPSAIYKVSHHHGLVAPSSSAATAGPTRASG